MDSSPATYDPSSGVIAFAVNVAGKAIPCRVSTSWLRDAYGDDALAGEPLEVFGRRRANIEAAALRAWLASRGAEPVQLRRGQVWRQGAGEKARVEQPG